MNLLDKRFRSKTSSAAHLPPVRLVLILSKSLSALNYANHDTVSIQIMPPDGVGRVLRISCFQSEKMLMEASV
jgi:hypothetical protein